MLENLFPWKEEVDVVEDWDDFKARFMRAVMQLTDRSYLVLVNPETGQFTVQMTADEDILYIHCSIQRLNLDDPAVTSRLYELGWDDKHRYSEPDYFWGRSLDLPAMSTAYQRLADDCVATMREVQGIASPAQLRYKAWREPERIPDGQLYYEEDLEALDPGEKPMLLDLGIQAEPLS
ncbi:MAG: hypothetical protein Q4D96_01415 [Propionibacteriaceae bacterium]|nr:hypothetical protein [Propionibacteriaceae bacterium]